MVSDRLRIVDELGTFCGIGVRARSAVSNEHVGVVVDSYVLGGRGHERPDRHDRDAGERTGSGLLVVLRIPLTHLVIVGIRRIGLGERYRGFRLDIGGRIDRVLVNVGHGRRGLRLHQTVVTPGLVGGGIGEVFRVRSIVFLDIIDNGIDSLGTVFDREINRIRDRFDIHRLDGQCVVRAGFRVNLRLGDLIDLRRMHEALVVLGKAHRLIGLDQHRVPNLVDFTRRLVELGRRDVCDLSGVDGIVGFRTVIGRLGIRFHRNGFRESRLGRLGVAIPRGSARDAAERHEAVDQGTGIHIDEFDLIDIRGIGFDCALVDVGFGVVLDVGRRSVDRRILIGLVCDCLRDGLSDRRRRGDDLGGDNLGGVCLHPIHGLDLRLTGGRVRPTRHAAEGQESGDQRGSGVVLLCRSLGERFRLHVTVRSGRLRGGRLGRGGDGARRERFGNRPIHGLVGLAGRSLVVGTRPGSEQGHRRGTGGYHGHGPGRRAGRRRPGGTVGRRHATEGHEGDRTGPVVAVGNRRRGRNHRGRPLAAGRGVVGAGPGT